MVSYIQSKKKNMADECIHSPLLHSKLFYILFVSYLNSWKLLTSLKNNILKTLTIHLNFPYLIFKSTLLCLIPIKFGLAMSSYILIIQDIQPH